MKNWKIIAWLILFFPLGICYMHLYSDWSKKLTYSLTGLYGLLLLVSLFTHTLPFLGLYLGLSLFLTAIGSLGLNLYRKTSKTHSLVLLISGLLLTATTYQNVEVIYTEVRVAAENEELLLRQQAEKLEAAEAEKAEKAALLAEANDAVIKAEEEKTRENLDLAFQSVYRLPDEHSALLKRLDAIEVIVLAEEQLTAFTHELEAAEKRPTVQRLSRLEKMMLDIEELDEEYINRFNIIQEEVLAEQERVRLAEQALETAEKEPNQANVEAATIAIAAQSSNNTLTRRLVKVEEAIAAKEAEEEAEKLAAEKARIAEAERVAEAERQAKAEADRLAKEAADKQAAEQAAAQTASSSQSSKPAASAPAPSTPTGEQAILNFLNTASHGDLQAVSYIGTKRAQYIVEYRQNNGPFTHSSQVKNVNQIGDGIYNNLLDMFR